VSTDLDRMKREAERLRAQQQAIMAAQRAEEEKRRAREEARKKGKGVVSPFTIVKKPSKKKSKMKMVTVPKSRKGEIPQLLEEMAVGSRLDLTVGKVEQAEASITKAKETIKQAESLSTSYGSKIEWGNETYDLGSTEGWKEYKAAVRKTKSEINEAENELKKYKTQTTKYKTALKANEVIEAANDVIDKSNKIIEQSNKDRKALYESQVKLYETVNFKNNRTQKFLDAVGNELETTALQLFDQINDKVKDSKQASKIVKALAPVYAETVTARESLERMFDEINNRKRDAEKRAEWDKFTWGGSGKRSTVAQTVARLEHLAISTSEAFVKTLPFAAVAATGPLGAGLVIASSTAYFVSPKNRYYTAVFIGAHPQEFYASIAGSLAAGVSVSKVRATVNKYRAQIKSTALKNKMDKLIDDYAYLEQHKGAEYPSRAIEIPEPYGKQIIVSNPVDPEAQIIERFIHSVASGNEPEAIAKFFTSMKDAELAMYYDSGSGSLETVTIPELLKKHPELNDPFIHPAFQDPNLFNKADLVARIPGSNIQVTPLMAAALAQAAKKGYFTDADIKALIKSNMGTNEILEGIDLSKPWTEAQLKELNIPDAYLLVGAIPTEIQDVGPVSATQQMQELAQLEELEPIEEPPLPLIPVIVPEPTPPPPEEPKPFLPKSKPGERRDIRLRLWGGPKEKYRVKFSYPKGQSQTLTVEARSFPEAVNKAQRSRRGNRYLPSVVDITKVK